MLDCGLQCLNLTYRQLTNSKLSPEEWPYLQALYRNGPKRMGKAGLARNGQRSYRKYRPWLSTIQGKRCKDPRDYVYALLYLFPPGLRDSISIDYRVPYLDLFASFTRSYIQATEDLSIIVWGKSRAVDPGVPSWTVNPREGAVDPFTVYDLHLRRLSSNIPTFKFSDDLKELQVRGKSIGEVISTCSLGSGPNELLNALGLSTDSHMVNRLKETLWLGQVYTSMFQSKWPGRRWNPYMSNQLEGSRVMFKYSPHSARELIDDAAEDIGGGPQCLRPRDKIVLVFGCSPLAVLRPVGDKYRVIGDAYVDRFGGRYSFNGQFAGSEMLTLI